MMSLPATPTSVRRAKTKVKAKPAPKVEGQVPARVKTYNRAKGAILKAKVKLPAEPRGQTLALGAEPPLTTLWNLVQLKGVLK